MRSTHRDPDTNERIPTASEPGSPITDIDSREEMSVAPDERVFVGTGLFWGLIVGLILATGVVILAAQNTASATVTFLGWSFTTSLIVLILGGLLIGVILDELFGLVYRARRRRTLSDRQQIKRRADSKLP